MTVSSDENRLSVPLSLMCVCVRERSKERLARSLITLNVNVEPRLLGIERGRERERDGARTLLWESNCHCLGEGEDCAALLYVFVLSGAVYF